MTDFDTTPLIIDDDGSQDGMSAIAYMLANPQFDVQAITISNGIANPEVFDDNLLRMLDRLGDLDVPVGVGQPSLLEGSNEFPNFIREASNTFWSPFVSLPESTLDIGTQDAVDLIIETVNNSPEPVAILATGPLTNIAEALRRDPNIIENIEVVQIMGGAVFTEGNLPVLPDPPFSTNTVAEFNIWIDPVAAQEVFVAGEQGLNIQLTPLDATNQIEFDRQDYQEWLDTGTPESEIAAEFLDYALEIIQSDNDPNPVWDLVAAINLAEPDFSPETPLYIDVDTESDPGNTQGQTFVVPNLSPNVNVSLNPNFDNLSFDEGQVFDYLELPIVGFSVDRTVIVEGGDAQILTFNLSEPAPAGGLVVNIRVDDPDGDSGPGDTSFPPEFITNIMDFGQVEEDGIITASLTIAEGATEATFGVVAFEDDLVEVGETYSFTLLEDENYIVDLASTTITTTIEDSVASFLPVVNYNADRTVVSEGGEAQLITFNLSEPAPAGGLAIKLRIDDPDGEPGDTDNALELFSNVTDFNDRVEDGVFVANITIAEGATEATIGIKALADNQVEGAETYSLTLLENENYIVDPASTTITTTIEDNMTLPTVSITPETVLTTEGDSFAWNISLDEPVPEGGLTLNLVITQNTEPTPGDASPNFEASSGITERNLLLGDNETLLGFTYTLAEGITEAILVADTVVDDIPETDEIGSLTIADGENYRANPNQNSLTNIFTDRTIVTLTTDEVNVAEGDTFAWNFSLNRPAPEGGLTLALPITQNNDPAPGDVNYNVEGSTNISDFGFITENDVSIGFTLTIPEGETVATLVSSAVTDDIAEFDEIFTTVLADGNEYVANPVGNQVVTTIIDPDSSTLEPDLPSVPVVSVTPSAVISTEGDTFAWDFTLDRPVPEGGLTLSLPITQNNDPEPGDVIYNVDGSTGITDFDFIVEDNISIGFSVTLEEGLTSATLVSEAVADDNDLEEAADEIFTTVLADGVDYRANPDSNEVQTILTRETVVSFTPEQVNVAEGDTFVWNFSLNQPAPEGGLTLSLPITFNNDPEPGDVDYNVEGSTNISDFSFLVVDDVSLGFDVTIAEGVTEATLVSEAVVDDLEEGNEIFTTILNDGADYRANPLSKEVVTTIVEQDLSSELPVVSLTPETLIATEGETFAWNFSLDVPAPSGGLSLFLPITVNDDPAPGDVDYNIEGSSNIDEFEFVVNNDLSVGFNLTIAEGATEAVLVSEAVVDDITETDETFTTVIADGVNYVADSEQNSVTTTITELPVVSLVSDEVTAAEGDTFSWDFSLNQPAPSGGLTLFLPITANNDPAPGDVIYNVEGSSNIAEFEFVIEDGVSIGFNLTIAEGATDASLVNEVVADDVAESDEIATIVVADGINYRANSAQNQVVTTFSDADISTDLPTVSITPENVNVTEGETFAWNISLSQPAPSGGLALSLPITFNNDPEPGDVEYNIDGSSGIADFEFVLGEGVSESFNLTIAEGETEAVLVSQAISDDVSEETEIFTTAIAQGDGYLVNPEQNEVTTTISDADTSTDFPTVSITPLPTLNVFAEPTEVPEGSQLLWNFILTEAVPEGGLTVALDLVEDTDPLPGDITYFVDGSENISDFELIIDEESGLIEQALVTLNEGVTSATLVNDIIADNATEGEESVSFTLAESEGYSIDPEVNAASFTILDTSTDLPTISVIAEPTEVPEGSQLLWNFILTEAVPEGGLTVALDLVEDTDPLPGDITYFVDGSENISDFELIIDEESGLIEQALVTLNEGVTSATLVNDIIADNATEGEESVSFALAESEDYAIDPQVNAASFTILDTSTDLITTTSTSISFELEDLLVPARDAVVDVSFDLDYVLGIDSSEFIEVGAIADSIENYLASNFGEGNFFEVITEDLGEFLINDAGLGIGSVAESIAVELDVEPNLDVPFPFTVSSTIEVEQSEV